MTPEEVLCALDALAVQTGSLACLGCGHEHICFDLAAFGGAKAE